VVILLATLVRSSLGFGEALVAVPLLALVMPVEVAAPIAALVSVTVAAIVLAQDWGHVRARSAVWLVLATVPGIPLGLLLLTRAPEPLVKALLGTVIIAFAVYSLARARPLRLEGDRRAWIFGFSAGILGGAYGMNGPPLVIYGSLRGWSPQQFRATLQGYFLPASAMVMAGYAMAGLWTQQVTRLYLISLPAALLAILAGRAINRRLNTGRFAALLHIALIIIGAVLVAQAI